jgi:streptococcal pilin isopeptide linkage domain
MFKNNPFRRLTAMALSVIMVLTLAPMTVFAEGETPPLGASGEVISTASGETEETAGEETTPTADDAPETEIGGEIISFAPLDEEIEKQAVIVGGSVDEVYLPATLTATVQIATDTDTPEEEAEPSFTTEETEIPVIWDCSPAFDGNQTGVYTFTPVVEGYTVSATLPQITVGVIQGIQTFSTSYNLSDITASIESGTNSGTGWSHANNIITFSEAEAITISGTASAYSVVVSNSTNITLAAGTEITGKERYAAFTVPGGATITGGGASVNITGGTSNNTLDFGTAIQSYGAITLAGAFGAIEGGQGGNFPGGHGIRANGDITIAVGASIDSITGGNSNDSSGSAGSGIYAGSNIIIAGTITGDIKGGNNTRSNSVAGSGGPAIHANLGNVTITETGRIDGEIRGGDSIANYGGYAIYAGTEVIISGTTGTITAGSSGGNLAGGREAIVGVAGVTIDGTTGTITGGATSNVGYREGAGIAATQGNITLTGQIDGIVSADYAILSYNANVTVTIGDNILTDGEYSLYLGNASTTATIIVDDGVMFVSGSGADKVSYAGGSGAMFSWIGSNTTYTARTRDDISISPATATAYWTTSGGDCGIYYENGSNTGFIPIAGVTLNKITPTIADLTYTIPTGHVYTGSAQGIGTVTLPASHGTEFNATTGGVVTVYYDGSTTVPTDAGTYAVTADISGGTDYEEVFIRLEDYTIEKAPLTITGGTVDPKIYDGTVAANVTAVIFSGLQNSETLTLGDDYTVAGAAFNNSNAVPSKTVTGTVALVADGPIAKNYTLADGSFSIVGQTITKATISGVNQTFEVVKDQAHTYSYDLTALLPNVAPGIFNNVTYSITSVTNNDGVLAASPSMSTVILLSLDVENVTDIDKTATITVTVSSLNYNDFTADLTVKTVDKQPVTITANMAGGVYNGAPYAYSNAVVRDNVTNNTVSDITLDVLYESTDSGGHSSATAPTNAGDYKLTLSVPGANLTYTGSAVFNFSIAKRPITAKADNKSVTQNGTLPALTYTIDGQIGGDTALIGTPSVSSAATTAATGTFPIVVDMTGVTYTANYMAASPAFVNGTLTVAYIPVLIGITAKTIVTGAAMPSPTFHFSMFDSDNIEVLGTWCEADGTIAFDPLSLTETGTHIYTFKETSPPKANWTHDSKEYTVTITIETNSVTGALQVKSMNYSLNGMTVNSEDVIFTNTYTPPGGGSSSAAVIITHPQGASLNVGGGHTMSVVATGTNLRYQWYKNGTIISLGGNADTYVISNAISSDAGSYTVSVTADIGSTVTSNAAVVNVGGGGSGSSGSGGSSGGGSTNPSTPAITTAKQPNLPKTATTTINGTVQSGNVTTTITNTMVQNALSRAGTDPDGIALIFNVNGSNFTGQVITIEAAALQRLVSSSVKYAQVETGIFKVSFDTAALAELNKQTTGTVTISATPVPSTQGNRPAFDITIKDSTGKNITSLGTGEMMRGIAYTPTASERTGNLYIRKLVNGKWEIISNSSYNNGWVIWNGNTCSVYGVAYQTPTPAFTDINGHWAAEHIDFAVSRGIMSGTSSTTFEPNTVMTRGMFITMLGRVAEADVSGYTTSRFTDVNVGSYYSPYVEWAVENKIVSGTGNNQFSPNRTITREEMAVMMVNYANALNYKLPVALTAFNFTDSASISAYAKDAVAAVQQAGIIVGKDGGRFDPKGNLTRAEAATVVRRFVEVVIDSSTARGWTQNESGQWFYYSQTTGKALTGWQTIDGNRYYFNTNGTMRTGWLDLNGERYCFYVSGKMVSGAWVKIGEKHYYFYEDGKLATNTTIDGYSVGADGARK